MSGHFTVEAQTDLPTLMAQLDLLWQDGETKGDDELAMAPVFTEAVHRYGDGLERQPFTQYGLLGGDASKISPSMLTGSLVSADKDPRVYYNIKAPSSVFICGSQGSGKSHTLSCLLENCLMPSDANVLPKPLTGIVFHYDTFISDTAGSPCEAAYLSSNHAVQVRVLCPPTNVIQIRRIYSRLPKVSVEELRLDESDLNTQRMLDLMAVSSVQSATPLYLHVVTRILRDLRLQQQATRKPFNYAAFRQALDREELTPGQMAPLKQRLDTLESFMSMQQVTEPVTKKKRVGQSMHRGGSDWTPKAGQLTIVDLSCPCVTKEAACSLFSICLSLFLEQSSDIGRVIAMDEAHKYMSEAAEDPLTELLLATIRLQRHIGTRVFISTQEPTISPKLLDLCSVTVVHRFSSPDWLRSLKKHLAGASALNLSAETAPELNDEDNDDVDDRPSPSRAPSSPGIAESMELFHKIVGLRTGEALMFAPSAVVAVKGRESCQETKPREAKGPKSGGLGTGTGLVYLHHGVIKIRIRKRITEDGGRSVMAT